MSHVIRIPLPADAPAPWEEIPAEALGERRFRLLAPPWISYEVAAGDEVEAEPDADEAWRLVRVLHGAGHLTLRILFAENIPFRERAAALLAIKAAGGRAEDAKGRYQVFDLGPEVELEDLLVPLEAASDAEHLEYELVDSMADED